MEGDISEVRTAWAVNCNGPWDLPEMPGCGTIYLTDQGYTRQMSWADRTWRCPKCGSEAMFNDLNHDEFNEEENEIHNTKQA